MDLRIGFFLLEGSLKGRLSRRQLALQEIHLAEFIVDQRNIRREVDRLPEGLLRLSGLALRDVQPTRQSPEIRITRALVRY
jgi:hypothetical protein